jgi:ribosome maturation factor RimP
LSSFEYNQILDFNKNLCYKFILKMSTLNSGFIYPLFFVHSLRVLCIFCKAIYDLMVFFGDYNSKKIEESIEDFLFRRGFELVDMKLDTGSRKPTIEVYADKLGGISIRDLSEINERLKLHLAASELVPPEFSLIVSSPGLDRVIKKEADFKRFLGRQVRIDYPDSNGKTGKARKVFLIAFDDGILTVENSEGLEEKIPLKELKRVRLVPEYDFSGINKEKDKD